MSDYSPEQPKICVAELSAHKPHRFNLCPDAPARAHLAQKLGIAGIRKLTFKGTLCADGKSDWRLEATLGATVIQPCVVTLAPVVTRIDKPAIHRFIAGLTTPEGEDETEMPEDETLEPLAAEIDLGRAMAQALALALPDYPRRDGAALGTHEFAAPGVTPMTDEDARPFAGLADLRDKLDKSR